MLQINWSDIISPADQHGERGTQPIILNQYIRKPSGKLAAVPAVTRKLAFDAVVLDHRQIEHRRHPGALWGVVFGQAKGQQLSVSDAVWVDSRASRRVTSESLTLAVKLFDSLGLQPVGIIERSGQKGFSPVELSRLARFSLLFPGAVAVKLVEGEKLSYDVYGFYTAWQQRLKYLGLVNGALHSGRPIQYLERKSQGELVDLIKRLQLDPEAGDFLERLSRNTSVTRNTISPDLFGNLVDALDIEFAESTLQPDSVKLPTVYRGVLPNGYSRYINLASGREMVSYQRIPDAVEYTTKGFEPVDSAAAAEIRDATISSRVVIHRVNRALGYYQRLFETRLKFRVAGEASVNGNLTFSMDFADRMEGDPEFNRLLSGADCFAFTLYDLPGQPVADANSLAALTTFDEPDLEFEPNTVRLPEPYHSQVEAGIQVGLALTGQLPVIAQVNLVGDGSSQRHAGCEVLSLGASVAYLESVDGFPVSTGIVDRDTRYIDGCQPVTEAELAFYQNVQKLVESIENRYDPGPALNHLDRQQLQLSPRFGDYLSAVKRAFADQLGETTGKAVVLVSEFLDKLDKPSFARLTGSERTPDWVFNRDLLVFYLSLKHFGKKELLASLAHVWPEFAAEDHASSVSNELLARVFVHLEDRVIDIEKELDRDDPDLREFVTNSIENVGDTLTLIRRQISDTSIPLAEREAAAGLIRTWLSVTK